MKQKEHMRLAKKKRGRKLLKWIKWGIIAGFAYWLISCIYFGTGNLDERTGIASFFWAGLDDLGNPRKPSGLLINEMYPTFLDGIDGPYVFEDTVFVVNRENSLETHALDSGRLIQVETGMQELPAFQVALRTDYPIEPYRYRPASHIICISDIEGNLTGLYSFLLSNGVIDKEGDWIFGDGSLVLNGDFFDRGTQVTPLLWFIYHLENQALTQGGKVHFILGNHELRNLSGNASDGDFKYREVAKRISGLSRWDKAISYLYGETSELGQWLRSKNVVEQIGDHIFVHGGLNALQMQAGLSLHEMNILARKYIGRQPGRETPKDKRAAIMLSATDSPSWDRRLNMDWKVRWTYWFSGIKIKPTTQEALDQLLTYYKGDRIIIGHSPVGDITTGYQQKVIKIDVAHGETLHSGQTRGLLIEQGQYFKIDDRGGKTQLF